MNLPCHISGLVFMGSTFSKGEGGGGLLTEALRLSFPVKKQQTLQ